LENKEKPTKDFYKDDISKIAKNAGISGFGEIFGNIINYTSNVLVTRTIGPSSFGIYVLASNILSIVSIFSFAGLDTGLLRFVALYHGKGDQARLKGVILGGTMIGGAVSFVLFFLFFFTSDFISTRFFANPNLSLALRILLISLPFTTLIILWLGVIQGFQLIKYRVYVERFFQPISRLLFLIILFLLGMKLLGLLFATVLSAITGFLIAFWYLRKHFLSFNKTLSPLYENRILLKFSIPIIFVRFFSFVIRSTDILMLGHFMTSYQVGIYGAVDRVLPLILLPHQSLNIIFSPMISELYGKKDFLKLETLFKLENKWAISLSLPVSLMLIIFAHPIMNIFGTAFSQGVPVLILKNVANLTWVFVGSTGLMLMMTGHQHISLANTTVTAITNIILNYLLIPKYGIIGAAVATTISLVAINIVELTEIYYLFGFHPFRWDILKPISAGIFSSLIILAILRFDFIKLHQNNILLLGALIILFLTLYLLSLILLGLSDEDKWMVKLIQKRLGIER